MPIVFNSMEKMIIELNEFIHHDNSMYKYHMEHIKLVRNYALLLNRRLDLHIDNKKLAFIALAHDILKERSLNSNGPELIWKKCRIPQDLNRYVRTNLDILEEFHMEDYFSSSCQFHALAAAIFLYKELNIKDPEVIYPIMFHSCPVIEIYETLPKKLQNMVDVIMLSDKLSSNYLRINLRGSGVRVDLDQVVFGTTGMELNYSLGLYIARLISQGKSEDKISTTATEYFYKRLKENNPFMFENYSVKKLGGSKIWPRRKSQAWRMR